MADVDLILSVKWLELKLNVIVNLVLPSILLVEDVKVCTVYITCFQYLALWHPPVMCTMCYVPCVMCHVSYVIRHVPSVMSCAKCHVIYHVPSVMSYACAICHIPCAKCHVICHVPSVIYHVPSVMSYAMCQVSCHMPCAICHVICYVPSVMSYAMCHLSCHMPCAVCHVICHVPSVIFICDASWSQCVSDKKSVTTNWHVTDAYKSLYKANCMNLFVFEYL